MTTATPSLAPTLDADGRITQEIPCAGCGYLLVGRRLEEGCPECGASVRLSVERRWLWQMRADVVSGLRLGVGLLAVGLMLLMAPMFGPQLFFVLLGPIGVGLLTWLGDVDVLLPRWGVAVRRGAGGCAALSLVAFLFLVTNGLGGAEWLAMVSAIATLAFTAGAAVAAALHLSNLAVRIPAPRARRVTLGLLGVWGGAVCVVIIIAATLRWRGEGLLLYLLVGTDIATVAVLVMWWVVLTKVLRAARRWGSVAQAAG